MALAAAAHRPLAPLQKQHVYFYLPLIVRARLELVVSLLVRLAIGLILETFHLVLDERVDERVLCLRGHLRTFFFGGPGIGRWWHGALPLVLACEIEILHVLFREKNKISNSNSPKKKKNVPAPSGFRTPPQA